MQRSARRFLSPSALLLTCFGPLTCASGAAFGQAVEFVLEVGDVMPLGDHVQYASAYAIGDRGDWAASIRTDHANSLRASLIVHNGQPRWRSGDPLATPGFTAGRFTDVQIDERGRVVMLGAAAGPNGVYRGVLAVDGAIALEAGQTVSQPNVPNAGVIDGIHSFRLTASGKAFVLVWLAPVPVHSPLAVVSIDLDAPGAAPQLVQSEGDEYSDGATLISVDRVAAEDDGTLSTIAWERTASGVERYAVRQDGHLVTADGLPSPIPGASWTFGFGILDPRAIAVNDSGSLALYGHLSPTSAGHVIARDQQAVVQTGVTVIAGGTVQQIDDRSFVLTETGQVLWHGRVGASQQVLCLDDEALLAVGMPMLGSAITAIVQQPDQPLVPISDNGLHALHWTRLADGREGLLRLERALGSVACGPAAPNSTGEVARLFATGSDLAGGEPLRLIAADVPMGSFGVFLCGRQLGLSQPAGSSGTLCLAQPYALFASDVQNSGPFGQFELAVDTTALPFSPTLAVVAGERWLFQAWFRDFSFAPTTQFTDAVEVLFR